MIKLFDTLKKLLWTGVETQVERKFLEDLRQICASPGKTRGVHQSRKRMVARYAKRLGIPKDDVAFLMNVDPDQTATELQRIGAVWTQATAGGVSDSERPRVVILLSYGQDIRSFFLTDVCRKIATWAQLYVLSPHDLAKEIGALGNDAHFLPIPSIRRARFDYMVGYLGFRHTTSPTTKQFTVRLDENLNRTLAQGLAPTRNLRAWHIGKKLESLHEYSKIYRWGLRYFATVQHLDKAAELLAQLRPDVVFNTSTIAWPSRLWTRAAALNGTPVISNVISWDNISTKTLLDEFVDTFLVWSEEMDEDFSANLPWLRAKRRVIVGSPQFEPIVEGRGLKSRDVFFSRYGLDPHKKLILYTTGSKTLFPREEECLDAVLTHWRDNLRERANIMVRMHPKDRQGHYEGVMKKFAEVPFTLAGDNLGSDEEWVPCKEDIALLVNQLHHCDVIVNVASTMTLEGFVVDKPAINIGFTLGESISMRYPMDDYYISKHYRDVVETGAARLVNNYSELFEALAEALEGTGYNVDKQRAILFKKCKYTTDSSDRINDFLRAFLDRRQQRRRATDRVWFAERSSGIEVSTGARTLSMLRHLEWFQLNPARILRLLGRWRILFGPAAR